MKRLFLLFLLMLPFFASAQTLVISDFYLDVKDQTANNEATKVVDDNNDVCALLRIETTQKGFSFDGGTIGIVKVEESKVGEIWVYVPAGLSHITIRHPQLGTLRDYYFPEKLLSARTYVMKLGCGEIVNMVKQKLSSQFLVLKVEPIEAIVEIDDSLVVTSNGVYSKALERGKHNYRASLVNYHPEVGLVDIGAEKKNLNIKLHPAFGWIEVMGPNGAVVYIDDKKIGFAPIKTEALPSGEHNILIAQEKYLPHKEQVLVADSAITTIEPTLMANYVTVNVITDANAEIWINEEKKGVGSVTLDLEPGEYVFESRKLNHLGQSLLRNINLNSEGTINIPAPIAIVGSLSVDINPIGANIHIDGNFVGESPLIIEDLIIGQHEILATHSDYNDLRKNVQIIEGQMITFQEELTEYQEVKLSCGVEGAKWFVDGIDRGTGSDITVKLSGTEHFVTIQAKKYVTFSSAFDVTGNIDTLTFFLKSEENERTNSYYYNTTTNKKSEYYYRKPSYQIVEFYPKDANQIGGLIGGMNGFSYKHFIYDSRWTVGTDLYFGLQKTIGWQNGMKIENMSVYDFVLNPNFLCHFGDITMGYVGIGGTVGLADNLLSHNHTIDDIMGKGGVNIELGMEWNILDFVLGLDFRPGYAVYFGGQLENSIHAFDWHLGTSMRYSFNHIYLPSPSYALAVSGDYPHYYLEGIAAYSTIGDFLFGAQFTIQRRAVGGYVNYLYGIDTGSSLFQGGLSFRLTEGTGAKVDLQMYIGPSVRTDFVDNTYYGGNLGIRFGNKKANSNFGLWSGTLGCTYLSSGEWVPTIGLSMPIALVVGAITGLAVWKTGAL